MTITRHPASAHRYDALYTPMTILSVGMSVMGGIMQASQTRAAGRAEQQAALVRQQALEHQAEQARINAGQEKALAQRRAVAERKKGQLIESRALAVGAASGADVASMEHIFGDIGAEEEYRVASALFDGDVEARHLNLQADLKQFEGQQEARAGRVARQLASRKATGQIFGGGGKGGETLYRKYG